MNPPASTTHRPRPPERGAGPASRRHFRGLNLTLFVPMFVAVGVLLVVRQAQTVSQGLVLGLGVVAVVVAFERWTAGDLARVAVPCLVVAAALWPYGALAVRGEIAGSFFPLCVVGSLVVSGLARRRAAAAAVLVGYVAAVGVAGLVTADATTTSDVVAYLLVPTGLTAVITALMVPNQGFYDVVQELEEARSRERELAVVRERMRFASELHDIQGHTLHVVKLKVALATKLLRADPERAEEELREIYALVDTTIAETKELAYGQRRLNFTAELENARNLFEAAGIRVRVQRDTDVRGASFELLGQVLREATTNILRHAQATTVRIEVTGRGIVVVNDGVPASVVATPPLRGLATLAARVADEGGRLTVAVEDGHFRTAATLPAGDAPGSGR